MLGLFRILIGAVVIGSAFGFPSSACAAEQIDITFCYSASGAIFYESKEIMSAQSWSSNGIVMSNSANKLLNNAVVHEEGVQRGSGAERIGYGLRKIVDDDGDAIIAEVPYTGFSFDVKFLEGTGKWKGIKGSLHSERLVRSKPGKGAMPGTAQGCRREQGTFELAK